MKTLVNLKKIHNAAPLLFKKIESNKYWRGRILEVGSAVKINSEKVAFFMRGK
jgi:hypothetical protein